MKRLIIALFIVLNISCFLSCEGEIEPTADKAIIFKNTVVYDLANAIEGNNYNKFKLLLKEITLNDIQCQEDMFGFTLLHWTIYRNNLRYSKILLEMGCDPNIVTKDGSNCLVEASESGNYNAIKLLVKFKVDVNCVLIDSSGNNINFNIPVIQAAFNNLESVNALVLAGANPKIEIIQGTTRFCALHSALLNQDIDLVDYLIFDCKVNFKDYFSVSSTNDTLFIAHYLRGMLFDLESKNYKKKMKLINFLSKNDIDYFSTEIPKYYYKNYDSLYLSKY